MADALDLVLGYLHPYLANGTTISSFALNQSTDALEVAFGSHTNEAITHLYTRLASITGTTPTYRISLQGQDSSGNPDGTIKGGGTPASATFSPSGLGWSGNSGHWVALDNSYTPSRGEKLCHVIDYSSGTIDGSNFATFSNGFSVSVSTLLGFPFVQNNDATVRAKAAALPLYGYRTASKRYGNPLKSLAAVGVFNSGSGTNEYGHLFSLPSGWSDTYTIRDIQAMLTILAAGNVTLRLYNGGGAGDTTVLQDVGYDTDVNAGTGARAVDVPFDEASLTSLTFGSSYRVSVAPDTVNLNLTYMEVEEQADWDAWQGGQNFQLTQRGGGNWTDTPTRRLVNFGFTLGDITEPAGGSGLLIHPGMTGRMAG